MLRNIFVLTFCVLTSSLSLSAQKIKRVSGDYVYYAPENVSIEEAKHTALFRARIQALADEFGTVLSDNRSTVVVNNGEESSVDFSSLGTSSVKGEWLETIGEPEYEIRYEKNMIMVRCRVAGRAREIVTAPVQFDARILRNGTDKKYEAYDFRNNDDMYMSFSSPSDGYVAVYLVDGSRTAFCLLPYGASSDGYVKLKANTEYILFSKDHAYPHFDSSEVDEYTLFTDSSRETDYIYIIFSQNRFMKAVDGQGRHDERVVPRMLSFEDFQRWLTENRIHDTQMQMSVKTITISK